MASSRVIAHLDIAFPNQLVYLEADGFGWHALPSQLRDDHVRAVVDLPAQLERPPVDGLGLRVISLTVEDDTQLVQAVGDVCVFGGKPPLPYRQGFTDEGFGAVVIRGEPMERREAGALMRVNHVGEVCAQALYASQALATRDAALARASVAAGATLFTS